jgi:RimJ/RimL family protein N-acetyltransferase
MWTSYRLDDRERLRSFLETDRPYAAYAIADLEPGPFALCTWGGAECAGNLRALVLHYRGLAPNPLLLMGEADGVAAVLGRVLCPNAVSVACHSHHAEVVRRFYRWQDPVPMWRMALEPEYLPGEVLPCVRLSERHLAALTGLYALGGGDAFSPDQLREGVFYGVVVDGQLVAVAGTHITSLTYGIGAVGNVFTHPAHRGHGYATATTRAVVAGLLRRGVRDVVLNVAQRNRAAIHVYEKLGFERCCPFLEGPAARRSLPGDGEPIVSN